MPSSLRDTRDTQHTVFQAKADTVLALMKLKVQMTFPPLNNHII